MANDDFRPVASIADLQRRAAVLASLRDFFNTRGFWEVETPLLSRDTIIDAHLEPVALAGNALALADLPAGDTFYLQTSPEFAMKRLLASGADRIFQICKAFRAGECGPTHNPEFTMLEWYHCADYGEGMALLEELVRHFWPALPLQRLTYRELFSRYLDVDPLALDLEHLRRTVCEHIPVDAWSVSRWDRDDCLNALLTEIQDQIGRNSALIIFDWPISQAALARSKPNDPHLAERFELYVSNLELANGYCELTDANELERRMREANRRRAKVGKREFSVNTRLLAAQRFGLPPACGVALGVDRLVMALLQKSSIDQIMAFPLHLA